MGCRMSSGRAMVGGDREEAEGPGPEGEEGGPGPPWAAFSFVYLLCFLTPAFLFFLSFVRRNGSRKQGSPSMARSG